MKDFSLLVSILFLLTACSLEQDTNGCNNDSTFSNLIFTNEIRLPSIQSDDSCAVHSTKNGKLKLSSESFNASGITYYPISVSDQLYLCRWVQGENHNKQVYSPIVVYLKVYADEAQEQEYRLSIFAIDCRFLQQWNLNIAMFRTQLPLNGNFSGVYIESTTEGAIIGGEIYYAGKITRYIQPTAAIKCGRTYAQRSKDGNFSISFVDNGSTRTSSIDYNPDNESFNWDFCNYCHANPCVCGVCSNCDKDFSDCKCTEDPMFCIDCERSPCECLLCMKCNKKTSECTCSGKDCICSCSVCQGKGYHKPR